MIHWSNTSYRFTIFRNRNERGKSLSHFMTRSSDIAERRARTDFQKGKSIPGFEPSLLGQNAIALPLCLAELFFVLRMSPDWSLYLASENCHKLFRNLNKFKDRHDVKSFAGTYSLALKWSTHDPRFIMLSVKVASLAFTLLILGWALWPINQLTMHYQKSRPDFNVTQPDCRRAQSSHSLSLPNTMRVQCCCISATKLGQWCIQLSLTTGITFLGMPFLISVWKILTYHFDEIFITFHELRHLDRRRFTKNA